MSEKEEEEKKEVVKEVKKENKTANINETMTEEKTAERKGTTTEGKKAEKKETMAAEKTAEKKETIAKKIPQEVNTNLPSVKRAHPGMILSIVATISIAIGAGIFIFWKNTSSKTTTPVIHLVEENQTLALKNLSVQYPTHWNFHEEKTHQKMLSFGNARIVFSYAHSPHYITTNALANATKREYRENGHEILEDIHEVAFPSTTWESIISMQNGRKVLQLFFVDGEDTYSCSYFCVDDAYNTYLEEFQQICQTFQMERYNESVQTP